MIHARLSLCRGTGVCVFAQDAHCLAHFFLTRDQDRRARVLRERKLNRGCITQGMDRPKRGEARGGRLAEVVIRASGFPGWERP
ncbi:hypothetical protein BA190_32935 [Labrys sp. WJW]|nr:hypothetical protein BA190_32935 [Labrys sp. WJW]